MNDETAWNETFVESRVTYTMELDGSKRTKEAVVLIGSTV